MTKRFVHDWRPLLLALILGLAAGPAHAERHRVMLGRLPDVEVDDAAPRVGSPRGFSSLEPAAPAALPAWVPPRPPVLVPDPPRFRRYPAIPPADAVCAGASDGRARRLQLPARAP